MKITHNKSESESLRQKAEELLKRKSEDKILELIEELAFQNEEKEKRAEELVIANKELAFQNEEKTKRADELSDVMANALKLIHELDAVKNEREIQNEALMLHQVELEMQNKELSFAKEKTETDAKKYAELYDFAPSGYFTLSKDGTITEVNFSGATMLGKDRSQLKDNRFGFFVSNDTLPIFNLFLDKVFSSKANVSCDVTLSFRENLPMYVHFTGVVSENGEQCLVSMVDITTSMHLKALHESKENLQKVNAEKDKFFSIIAHDLRGHFNGFLGLTRILAEDLDTLTMREVQKMAENMQKSATNLYTLLENLLEWSQMQRGISTFEPESFLIVPIISKSINLVMDSANKKEIEICNNIPVDLEIFADKLMFALIIRNLTTNAVKFTRKGGNVTLAAKPGPGHSVEISIRDTGIGMNPQMVDDLFRLDVQTNRKGTENEPSSGLGLLLCKEFIEKHGGKLWVESEEGKGSIFYFALPSAPPRNR